MSDSALCEGSGYEVERDATGCARCVTCHSIVGSWATAAEKEIAGRVVLRADNHRGRNSDPA